MINQLTRETRLAQSESVLFSEVEGGITLMNMDNAEYYHFDEVGAAIWKRIDGRSSIGEICAALTSEFDVDVSECESDTLDFLKEIAGLELVAMAG